MAVPSQFDFAKILASSIDISGISSISFLVRSLVNICMGVKGSLGRHSVVSSCCLEKLSKHLNFFNPFLLFFHFLVVISICCPGASSTQYPCCLNYSFCARYLALSRKAARTYGRRASLVSECHS